MEREQVQILANAARMGDKNALSALYNEYCGKICFFAEAVLGKTVPANRFYIFFNQGNGICADRFLHDVQIDFPHDSCPPC